MANLSLILTQEVSKYAGDGVGIGLRLYSLLDHERGNFGVIALDEPRSLHDTSEMIVVFARIAGDFIIVEVGKTDKPLIDALRQQGIPRDKIILSYQGETIPQAELSASD